MARTRAIGLAGGDTSSSGFQQNIRGQNTDPNQLAQGFQGGSIDLRDSRLCREQKQKQREEAGTETIQWGQQALHGPSFRAEEIRE